MADTFDIMNPFTKFSKPIKPKSGTKNLPSFSLTGSWSGDEYTNTGMSFDIGKQSTPNYVIKNKGLTPEVQPKGGIQTTSGYIMKDTLSKGAGTIMGMSEQVNQYGEVVQGSNYANINYPSYKSPTGSSVTNDRRINQQKKSDENVLSILDARVAASEASSKVSDTAYQWQTGTALTQTVVDLINANNAEATSTIDVKDAMSKQVAKNNEIRRIANYANFVKNTKNNPNVKQANEIQALLGRNPITAVKNQRSWMSKDGSTRIYSKRYVGELSADPQAVVSDYYKKKNVVDFAKKVDPKHANLDDVTVKVVASSKSFSAPRYWTHNNNRRQVGTSTWTVNTYKDVPATTQSEGDQMDLLYDKVLGESKVRKTKYEKYFEPIVDEDKQKEFARLTAIKEKGQPSGPKVMHHLYYRSGGATGSYMQGIHAINRGIYAGHQKNLQKHAQLELELHNDQFSYYGLDDKDFGAFETVKQDLISDISKRRVVQEEVIDRLDVDTKSIEKKDRSEHRIPTLETAIGTLDKKAVTLKKQVGEHDWQKTISQEVFGTDTIQGDSHVSAVLDSYGGKVRGGNYYSQDVGNLSRKTKVYEKSLEEDIKQQEKDIKNIELDETDGLVDYFNETSDKEYATASKEYLSKSLKLTKEEREQLEKERQRQAFGENQQAQIHKTTQSRGRPSLKDVSKRQYKNTRTRGGQSSSFGGLVI